ncbi:Phosphatidylinositide phosphatase SAC2, partial [Fragariocoptes setiger]
MQLFHSNQFYLLVHDDRQHALCFNRLDASIRQISYESAMEFPDLKLISRVYGFIGKFLKDRLVFIKSRNLVGNIYDPIQGIEHEVYAIKNVLVVHLTLASHFDPTLAHSTCEVDEIVNIDASHCVEIGTSAAVGLFPGASCNNEQRKAPWDAFNKAVVALKPRLSSLYTSNVAGGFYQASSNLDSSSLGSIDDIDKRLTDEMCKLFTDTNSFYYSYTIDLTNSFQRQHLIRSSSPTKQQQQPSNNSNNDSQLIRGHSNNELPGEAKPESSSPDMPEAPKTPTVASTVRHTWRTADERFFWNKHMLKDLIAIADGIGHGHNNSESSIHLFILPILHGFIQFETYSMATLNTGTDCSLNHLEQFPSIASSNSSNAKAITTKTQDASVKFSNLKINDDNNKHADSNCDTDDSNDSYVKTSSCGNSTDMHDIEFRHYQLGLISRRSLYRAGTRYRRRGCDEQGKCANFVETEQIFRFGNHFISFVMIRGSIPVFWSQPGFKYRPTPVVHRSEKETHEAFVKHFNELFYYYGNKIVVVDLTEQSGRESVVNQEYQRHCHLMNSPYVSYEAFDFHRHCRGRRLKQVEQQLATQSGINHDRIKNMRYFWYDSHGIVCEQRGVFRVNCVDCLDRTNIVQQSIALQVIDIAMVRLGLIAPDSNPENNQCRRIVQSMWANNGDVLSRQYAGSNALKGDFTRTGERKLTGYIKDTYSSASRYYISKFRDAYRQAAIDAMLGLTGSIESGVVKQVEHKSQDDSSDDDDLVVIESSELEHKDTIE